MREENAQEPALLAERGFLRFTLWQKTEMWDSFLPEILPSTRALRGRLDTMYPILWKEENSLRTQLL
jgi:hypothetical protein